MGQLNSFPEGGDDVDITMMAFQVRNIWKKKVSDLPVAKDLPRLARKFRIYNEKGEITNFLVDELQSKETQQKISASIFSIMTTLATELDDLVNKRGTGIGGMTVDVFEKEVNVLEHSSVNGFLERYFGDDSKTVAVLKACNQSIMAPAVTQLKKALLEKLNYKDVAGGWTVHVRCFKDEIVVAHRKKEQVIVKKNQKYEECYQFEWEFQIIFDRKNMSDLKAIALKFIGMDFNGEKKFEKNEQESATRQLKEVIQDLMIEFNGETFARYNRKMEKQQEKEKLKEEKRAEAIAKRRSKLRASVSIK